MLVYIGQNCGDDGASLSRPWLSVMRRKICQAPISRPGKSLEQNHSGEQKSIIEKISLG